MTCYWPYTIVRTVNNSEEDVQEETHKYNHNIKLPITPSHNITYQ